MRDRQPAVGAGQARGTRILRRSQRRNRQCANAAARKRLIAELRNRPRALPRVPERTAEGAGWSFMLHESGRYPLTGHGDSTPTPSSRDRSHLDRPARSQRTGRPDRNRHRLHHAMFFRELVRSAALSHSLDFENDAAFQPWVISDVRFCLLTVHWRSYPSMNPRSHSISACKRPPRRRVTMPPEEILLVNPNTGTAPLPAPPRRRDHHPRLQTCSGPLARRTKRKSLGPVVHAMLDMANDRACSSQRRRRCASAIRRQRWSTTSITGSVTYATGQDRADMAPRSPLTGQEDPDFLVQPRYWVARAEVDIRLANRGWDKLAPRLARHRPQHRRAHDDRSVCPCGGRPHLSLCSPQSHRGVCTRISPRSPRLRSTAEDRRTHLTSARHQFLSARRPPMTIGLRVHRVPRPGTHLHRLGHGTVRPRPRRRRPPVPLGRGAPLLLRAELDAAFFHLYGIDRDDVDYIMETFPIVKRKDSQPTAPTAPRTRS